jgi:hypothetical protein
MYEYIEKKVSGYLETFKYHPSVMNLTSELTFVQASG